MIRALRAEWTKLRTVRSTAFALLATLAVTLLVTVASASGSRVDYDGPKAYDGLTFAHRTAATGEAAFTARVTAQRASVPWAKAGLLLKDGTRSGSSYVALMVTPGHGIRMMADSKHELTSSASGKKPASGAEAKAPYWLRLTRAGDRVTGYDSPDGRTWHRIGTLRSPGLPAAAQAGLFVTSPNKEIEKRVGPTVSVAHPVPTVGRATFDHVTIPSADGTWRHTNVTQPPDPHAPPPDEQRKPGTFQRSAAGGTFTLTGSGDLGGLGMGGFGLGPPLDLVRQTLDDGIRLGLIGVIALGVLFITSEYRTGTLRTTVAASPRRGRVLAAKAVVLAGVVFVVGLVASVGAFLVAQPYRRANGYVRPLFDPPSLTDAATLRAIVGSALFLAVLAVFSLGVGALLRRTVPAIVLLFVLLVVAPLVASTTSITADEAVGRATPVAGMAIQQTRQVVDTVTTPWAGFAVLCLYAAAALGAAQWRLRRRDV
ncbi:hypothetical protein [Streptomyces sp. NPDC059009]|uniref:hypothetical protein n=1 Tax=Streptomyces sp. NPDC059009 TaxID=3346694 RepID=UPI0036CF2233